MGGCSIFIIHTSGLVRVVPVIKKRGCLNLFENAIDRVHQIWVGGSRQNVIILEAVVDL